MATGCVETMIEKSSYKKASCPAISAHWELQKSLYFRSFCCLLPPMVRKEAFPKINSSPEPTKHAMKDLKETERDS